MDETTTSENVYIPDTIPVSPSPSDSPRSSATIHSHQKVTSIEQPILHCLELPFSVSAIEEFHENTARAQHWRQLKSDLKKHVAKMVDSNASKKFEVEVKIIGR
jgi:hypothetical protein